MSLFDNPTEAERKANLKALEDKRLRFAERLDKEGFAPERMLFCSDEVGSFTALAKHDGKLVVIAGATFGKDDDFRIYYLTEPNYTREDIAIKGTGLNGMFGFGTKAAKGFKLHFVFEDDSCADFDFVAGRTSCLDCRKGAKNPLLSLKRRRGDANVVWEFRPVESKDVDRAEHDLDTYYLV